MSLIRRRKGSEPEKGQSENSEPKIQKKEGEEEIEDDDNDKNKKNKKNKNKNDVDLLKKSTKWSCIDGCCWFVGCICTLWWFLLFMYNVMPASFPQYVTEAITGPMPDPPGLKLKKEGLSAKHPVVFVPGIVTGGLELWEGHQCAEGLFRKRLWGGTFGEVYKRYK
jgi:phospholipid:diacylglycerol acyltransferase